MIRVAMLGFGGIAQSHKKAHMRLENEGREKLVAICDITPEQFTKRIQINIDTGEPAPDGDYHIYYDLDEMLKSEQIDVVDICIPSYLHADYAVKLLNMGYHVQCEKPMALNYADCLRVIEAAKNSGRRLMIGQVLRFYSEYVYLKKVVSENTFGRPTSVLFQRLSALPAWSWQNWYQDFNKSGSVILDMQVHDLDMARYLFGEPRYVECHASTKFVRYDMAQISLGYDFPVLSIGDWTLNGKNFSSSYRVGFEKATLITEGGKVRVYPADCSEPYLADFPHYDGMYSEIEYFLSLIESGMENSKNPPESAAETVRLVEAAWKSADMGGLRVAF